MTSFSPPSLLLIVAFAMGTSACPKDTSSDSSTTVADTSKTASSNATNPTGAAAVRDAGPAEKNLPPIVDMRGCMVRKSADEKIMGIARAAHDCPARLRDETRRDRGKTVTYTFTFLEDRTNDVRMRAVKEACCYDKKLSATF